MAGVSDTPKNIIIAALRAALTDHNSVNRTGSQWIYPGFPRQIITKNSYPRISLIDVGGITEVVAIGRTTMKTKRLQLDIWCWGDEKDPMILTISGVKHAGGKLLDRLGKDIEDYFDANRDDFDSTALTLHNIKLFGPRDALPEQTELQTSADESKHHTILRKSYDIECEYIE